MKILALTPWPIIPANSGGTQRCYQLLQGIDDLVVLSLDWDNDRETKQHQSGVTYHVVPADDKAKDQAKKLFKSVGLRSYDAIPSLTANSLTNFKKTIDSYDPDLIILEHPWLVDLIGDRPYIYDAQNCETVVTAHLFGEQTYDFELVKEIEQRCIREAEHIIYCSEADMPIMDKLQHITCPTTHIPNGTTAPKRTIGKENKDSKQLIFVGSMYQPNVLAVHNIISVAKYFPDYTFTIVGSCGVNVQNTEPNVHILGHLNDDALHNEFLKSHAFINPTVSGSGTQLKVAQALAYGLPVISTSIGARGYTSPIIVTYNTVAGALRLLAEEYETLSAEALAEGQSLDWENLRTQYKTVINEFQ